MTKTCKHDCPTCAKARLVLHPCDEFGEKVDDGVFHQSMWCDDWKERTDSVEQIAIEMWEFMIDSHCSTVCIDDFMARLLAQGIEVPK